MPPLLPRFVLIPNPEKNEGVRYVPLEDIIGEFFGTALSRNDGAAVSQFPSHQK